LLLLRLLLIYTVDTVDIESLTAAHMELKARQAQTVVTQYPRGWKHGQQMQAYMFFAVDVSTCGSTYSCRGHCC